MNEFGAYLQQRWNEGCHNATLLYQEIKEKGYQGKRSMVARFVAHWRKTGKATRSNAPQRISPKHAAILVTRSGRPDIEKGAPAVGHVTEALPKKGFGRKGKLNFSIDNR